jgi:hypothetical protein
MRKRLDGVELDRVAMLIFQFMSSIIASFCVEHRIIIYMIQFPSNLILGCNSQTPR